MTRFVARHGTDGNTTPRYIRVSQDNKNGLSSLFLNRNARLPTGESETYNSLTKRDETDQLYFKQRADHSLTCCVRLKSTVPLKITNLADYLKDSC